MEIVLVVAAFVLLVTGIFGAFIPLLPGPPLSFAGLLLLYWSGFSSLQLTFLLVWAGITAAVTIMDYVLPSFMAKRFGGSRAAAIGSFLGLLAGIFFFPPWGMIAGPFLGALAGEFLHTRGTQGGKAFKVAFGAFLAFFLGAGTKLIVSAIMLFYAVTSMF
jgi:uncharacterized protein YqgC (DUF456 family)